jgi:hypothetical protein
VRIWVVGWRAGGSRRRQACGSDRFHGAGVWAARAVRERRYSLRRVCGLEGMRDSRRDAGGQAGVRTFRAGWRAVAGGIG